MYSSLHQSKLDYSLLVDYDPDVNILNKHNDILYQSSRFYVESSSRNSLSTTRNVCSVLNLNIRIMPHNFDQFIRFKNSLQHNFSILWFSETWSKCHTVDSFNLDGYEHVLNIREKKRGSGISLFVSNEIYFNARADLTMPKIFYFVAIEISKDQFKTNKNIIVSIVYIPPDTSVVEFIEYYQAILSTVHTENKYMITMGDYNINTLKCLKTPTRNKDRDEFSNLLSSFRYQQLIDKPTRFSRNHSTLIDNIYTNYILDSGVCTSGIIFPDITDHFPIFTMISQFSIKDLSRKTITRRNLKKENFTKFKTQVMGGIWDPTYYMDCLQEAFSYFQSTFFEAFNKKMPMETVDVKHKNNLF